MFKVYIEGYLVKCARVQVETGIGPLAAQIVIPPGENRRKILPGSRILCMVKDGEEWFEWFQGTTTNMPETALGFDEHPVTLNVIGDFGLLQSILMNYLTLGQVDIRNETFKSSSFNGRVNLFRGGLGPLTFAFSQAVTNRSISFSDRLTGIIQALVSLDPQGWEDMRRLQYLDRVAIEMADEIADSLDQRIVMQSISEALGSIQTETFTALDVLNIILQLSMHELVSIAPVRFAGGKDVRKVNRHRAYMPAGMSLDDLSAMDQKTLVDKLCTREPCDKMAIDHFIKPIDRFHVPSSNKITKSMYNNAYVSDNGFTRAIIKIPMMSGKDVVKVFEELMPPQLKTSWDVMTAASLRSDGSPSLGAVSSVMSERVTGLRTNKEKVYGGVKTATIPINPRIYSMMSALATLEGKEKKTQMEYQKEYANALMRSEYEKLSGSMVNIQGGAFNLSIIPGFGIEIQDSKNKWYTGKLIKKIDVIDLEAEKASSSYTISECKANESLDYEGAVNLDVEMSKWFATNGTNQTSYTSPMFAKYAADGKDLYVESLLTENLGYSLSLSHNHLREVSDKELAPETRFTRNKNGLTMTDDGLSPSFKDRSWFTGEAFYSDFDLLTEVASQRIDATVNSFLFGTDGQEAPLPYLNLSSKEAVSILDTKNGNIFSVAAKTLGDETIKRIYAERAEEAVQKAKEDWTLLTTGDVAEIRDTVFREAAAAENARISGNNTEINDMFMRYNPNFPIYLGNPCPLRVEMLLYLMSRLSEDDLKNFLENGAVNRFTEEGIPKPLSDYQVIAMRRDVARRASNE